LHPHLLVKKAFLLGTLLLVCPTVHADRRPAVEPHLHIGGVIRGARLFNMARRHGDLNAGLKALKLGHLSQRDALRAARRMMDISSGDHGVAYKNIHRFKEAAFSGKGSTTFQSAQLRALTRAAGKTYLQVSANTVLGWRDRRRRVNSNRVALLLPVFGKMSENKLTQYSQLLTRGSVAGLDFCGEEKTLKPDVLERAVDMLVASKRPHNERVLRIHAGEGYLGKGGSENVNIALSTLAQRARRTDLSKLTIIIGHAARINDHDRAAADLRSLKRRGVNVILNVNPLSNILNHAVNRLEDIAALRLARETGTRLMAGTDNVGSLRANTEILRRLEAGDYAGANRKAKHIYRLRDRWTRHRRQSSGQPPGGATSRP
jgi:hypothetical protein